MKNKTITLNNITMFKKPIAWIKGLFGDALAWIRPKAADAIKIVNILKSFVESDAVGGVVAFTPTKVDDKCLAIMRNVLPQIAYKLQIVSILTESINTEAAITELIAYLRNQNVGIREMFYRELATLILEAMIDGELDRSDLSVIAQFIYKERKESIGK